MGPGLVDQMAEPFEIGRATGAVGVAHVGRARTGDHGQHQFVLGVVGDMVPPIPLAVVGRIGRDSVPLLLSDERPGLVELDLAGRRGEKATSSS